MYIRFLGNGYLWFRSYSDSLWKSPKVSKGLCPACRRLARARRSLTPALLRGPPRRAIHGPARLNRRPAGLPAPQYLRSASGLLGQSEPDPNQKQEHSGLQAGLSGRSQSKIKGAHGPNVGAGLLGNAVCPSPNASTERLHSRASPLPHFLTVLALDFDFALQHSSRLSGRCALDLFLILILGAPLNHAGRTQA